LNSKRYSDSGREDKGRCYFKRTTIMLMQGISINRIAKLYGVHRNTVKLFIKRKKLDSARNIKKVVNLCG